MRLDTAAIHWNSPEADRPGRPLVVLLHGYNADATQVSGLAAQLPPESVVAAVRAPLQEEQGFAWFSLASGIPTEPAPELGDPAATALIDWLDGLDGFTSVGLFGFSQGGAIALHTLRLKPDAAAWVVALAGFALGGERSGDAVLASTRPPVFWGRGAVDSVVPPAAVELTAEWLPAHSTLTQRVYAGLDHAVSPEEIADAVAFIGTTPAR